MRSSIIFILMLLQSQSLAAQTFNRGCEDSQSTCQQACTLTRDFNGCRANCDRSRQNCVQAAEQGRVQQQRQLPQYFLERPQ
jgi:hypothetical protein